MKIIRTFFLVFFLSLIFVSSVKAGPTPPSPPTAKSAGTAEDNPDGPPPPPPIEMPIDANLTFLLVGGLILGITVVYKNKIRKASM